MWNRNFVPALLAMLLLGPAATAQADDRAQVHGFFSQAAVHTDANEVGGNSRHGVGLDMREMGVNVSYRPDGDWLFSGQALARWAGNSDEGDLRLDYAFVDRMLIGGEATTVGVQVGKVKNPYGLYNTTRDVAHTRPSITMPQSVYLERIRNFFLAAPGVSLYGHHGHDGWDSNWRLNAMRPETDSEDLDHLLLLGPQAGEFRGRTSWLGQVMTEWDGGRLRLGLTLGEVRTRFRPGAGDLYLAGESSLKPRLLSLEWNQESWSLSAEYGQVKNKGRDYCFCGIGPEDPNTVEAWYLQGTYRLTPQLQVYLRRDEFYLDKTDRDGVRFANSRPGVHQAHWVYAKNWVLGVRHDWKNWVVSGEVHSIDGTGWVSPLDTPLASQKKDWRMLLLQAAYRF